MYFPVVIHLESMQKCLRPRLVFRSVFCDHKYFIISVQIIYIGDPFRIIKTFQLVAGMQRIIRRCADFDGTAGRGVIPDKAALLFHL